MLKKYIIIIVTSIFILCSILSIVFVNQSKKQRGLIFTLFRPELQKASDNFYSEYLSDNPSVSNYSGKIISLKKKEDGYYIKFGIFPYVGPHYPVGYDEVEYFVNNLGNITLLNFAHKKNYEFPERLNVKIKKPIPTS